MNFTTKVAAAVLAVLAFTSLASCRAAFAFSGGANDSEPNDSIETASQFVLDPALTLPNYLIVSSGSIRPAGDIDFYAFQVYAPGTVDLELAIRGSSTLPGGDLQLWDTGGDLGFVATPGSDGRYIHIFQNLAEGIYYPRVASSTNSMGTYRLEIYGDRSDPFRFNATATIGPVGIVSEPGACALVATAAVLWALPLLGAVLRRRA